MKFPFVSRDRYEEQRAELERVRAELATEREHSERLWNFLNWRTAGGVAFDTTRLPEPYQPRAVAPQPVVTGDEAAKDPIQAFRAPGQARKDLAKFEIQQEAEYRRLNTGLRAVPKEQVSSEALPSESAAAGD